MTAKIFTEQEKEFLLIVLELVDVDFTKEYILDDETGIHCTKFEITANLETERLIKHCLQWNYNKIFR